MPAWGSAHGDRFGFGVSGCAFEPQSGQLQLVLHVEEHQQQRAATWYYIQQKPKPHGELSPVNITVAGCSCDEPNFKRHLVTLHCQCATEGTVAWGQRSATNGSTIQVQARRTIGDGMTISLDVQAHPLGIHGELMSCTGRLIHGDLRERVRVLHESQQYWRAVGFETSVIFARTRRECDALMRVTGIFCDQRSVMDLQSSQRTLHQYEQPILQGICLAYAQVSQAAFLALADADDHPPAALPYVLDLVRQHDHLAGVRLFFDADLWCQPGFCPANETDWREQCKRANGRAGRNHWKPIVIPARTQEVSVHQFDPIPPFGRKQVWRICYHHRTVAQVQVGMPGPAQRYPALLPNADILV